MILYLGKRPCGTQNVRKPYIYIQLLRNIWFKIHSFGVMVKKLLKNIYLENYCTYNVHVVLNMSGNPMFTFNFLRNIGFEINSF